MSPRAFVLLAPLGLGACDFPETAAADADPARFLFVDVASEAGIDVVNVSGDARRWFIPESNGCGAAWLDHDGDGDLDLFVANGARLVYPEDAREPTARLAVAEGGTSRLYANQGELRFTDVTDAAGARRSEWINALATGDVEDDGDPDLYLACFGPDAFLRNDGGRFVEASAAAGLANPLWGAGAAFGDPDRDGDLDLYVANYCLFDPERPPGVNTIEGIEVAFGPEGENQQGKNAGAPDVFFRGLGDGRFEEATRAAGLELAKPLCSYACVFADVDTDGWSDLLVANDLQPANLFVNRRDGTFVDEALERGFALDAAGKPSSAMGLFVDDVDGDLDLDVLRTNFDLEPNWLHVNDGHGRFVERAAAHGLAEPSLDKLGWGGGFFDADLDGDLDLLVANGHVFPRAEEIGMHPWLQATQLYEAVPDPTGAIAWRDVTASAGPGLAPLRSARGVALGDPDDDGDVDALVVDLDAPPRLLENRTPRRGHWLAVSLEGTYCTRDAVGARIVVRAGGRAWMREVRTTDGLYSANDPRVHFGLGAVAAVDRVEIHWPSGGGQTIEAPPLDRLLVVREPKLTGNIEKR
jgi:hypothetical protein